MSVPVLAPRALPGLESGTRRVPHRPGLPQPEGDGTLAEVVPEEGDGHCSDLPREVMHCEDFHGKEEDAHIQEQAAHRYQCKQGELPDGVSGAVPEVQVLI